MARGPSLVRLALSAAGFLVCLLIRGDAVAQTAPPQEDPVARAAPTDLPSRDYMLGRPHGSLAVRGAWLFASAGSDVFDFVTEQLTLEKTAFNAPTLAVEVEFALSPRLDVVGGFDTSYTSRGSEYRDFVDNNRLPIEQTTSMKQFGVFGSVKYALTPRGRRVSRYAWVPRTLTPYVGAGGGMRWYEFVQDGDFVDFNTLDVFADRFTSKGWAPSAHAFGGVDVRVYRSLYVTGEGRYEWSSADLQSDFVGFDPIDLSGFRFGAGIRLMF